MFEPRDHVIHLEDGQLSPRSSTSRDDVRRLVGKALSAQAPAGIVIHFHGGLVSGKKARRVAEERLHPLYAERSGAYPVFFIWESGFFEAPLNNLQEIAREDLFREFVKKAGEWVAKKLPAGVGLKGGSGASVNEVKLRGELDAWLRGERDALPDEWEMDPAVTGAEIAAKTKGVDLIAEDLEAEIAESIEGDLDFQDAVQAAYNGLHAGGQVQPATKGVGTTVSSATLLSREAAARLFDPAPGTTKGFGALSWIKVAKVVARVVLRVIRRFRKGRAHRPYVTVVEETLRELYLDKIGRTVWWDRMKGDTADAFRDGPEYGGTAFLEALRDALPTLDAPPRITLVGHSTGAIYVCNLLKAAARLTPELEFDVIFEAPAATHALFAATVEEHGSRIRNFRQFGMSDEREKKDALVPLLYPSSLLYLVCGLLEQETDEPLVGMERFLKEQAVFDADTFPSIDTVRTFYAGHARSLVWAPSSAGPGLNSDGHSHGDFDDEDEATMASVSHILRNGF